MENKIKKIKMSGNKEIIVINEIKFRGRQNINWNEVKRYLKKYVGKNYKISDTKDVIYIGKDFADEYSGSNYTAKLKGNLAKAKANAAQGIKELVEIASDKRFKPNFASKHNKNAKYGWFRFDTRFAIPVIDDNGYIERFNIYKCELIIRYASDKKLYLYDVINIKKETGTPLEQ